MDEITAVLDAFLVTVALLAVACVIVLWCWSLSPVRWLKGVLEWWRTAPHVSDPQATSFENTGDEPVDNPQRQQTHD